MLEDVHQLIHESRSFIAKGLVSSNFFNFVQSITRSNSLSLTIIAEVYNFTYKQVFTHLWKPRCAQVIAHELLLGITNRDKRSKQRSWTMKSSLNIPHTQEQVRNRCETTLPWVAWFVASLRQGLEWLTYAYTPQADMFRSFTTSALNSFTYNHRLNLDRHVFNRVDIDLDSSM